MSFINFRTAILCCVFCLGVCSLSVNAQEITVDLSFTGDTTGNNLRDIDGDETLFMATPNADGITTSNELIEPIVANVPEAGPEAGLQLTIVNATATTGVDGFGGENRSELNVGGLGLALAGTPQRVDPAINATAFDGADLLQSGIRLDATHDELLTLAFNQDVIVSAIVIHNLDPGETFQFGSATNITDLSDMSLPDLTLGTITVEGTPGPFALNTFTFETPLEIPAEEEIVVGQTGFDTDVLPLAANNAGVGIERIILTLDEGTTLLGDVNMDGVVDFLDISPFITVLATGGFQEEADIDGNGSVDFLDISGFILILSST